MLTVQLSQQLDVCAVSAAMAVLWKDSTSIVFDGPVHKTGECFELCVLRFHPCAWNYKMFFLSVSCIAICRLPADSINISLNSTFTWAYVNMSASQINEVKNQLKW